MSELKSFVARKIDDGTCDPVPCVEVYLKSEADKVIAELEESHKMEVEQLLMEIVELKAMTKEPYISNRTCRKCGRVGTLMYMPIVNDWRIFLDLYNNKGIDYVFGIECAHCGEVAFVTKQTHERELRHHKYRRCYNEAKIYQLRLERYERYLREYKDCNSSSIKRWRFLHDHYEKWHKRWLELAEKFKEAK